MSTATILPGIDLSRTPRPSSGFDPEVIDRQSIADLQAVGSDKWTRYPGCIGAFIAEMDFGLAPAIQRAIHDATDRCALGYIPDPWKRRLAEACALWQRERYGWDVDPSRIRVAPDILEILEVFLREVVGRGHAIVVPTPAYMPFLSVPRLYGVNVIEVPMLRRVQSVQSAQSAESSDSGNPAATGWDFDFEAIERAFAEPSTRGFMLCNPHNPIGKVLTEGEMLRISELAARYDVRIFSDEIHAPFVYRGRHVPFATLNELTARQSMTATSASKSFNIPGTKCAQVILTNPDDYEMWMDRAEWSEHQTATIGAIATTAAYTEGGDWYEDMLRYVRGNERLLDSWMRGELRKVGYVEPQGSYIAWLDFSPLGIEHPADYFYKKAHVALTDGRECGRVGAGCVRMNFAMPRPLLEECLTRMAAALKADGLI
ncbi:MalY/PatB family protein [Bifidobacterium vespertilionis]|uniref:cysteine-S-conjugate beta-lyase n=1 Tax=Bifidobacterium vespertilionis TaxID=2562524 RepID=A0A5J5DTF2_9BIFI|nr:aminotransferase class I/II-fold pyridoxal phosphate-dependent enzyme [Bifidobacterium vespertilionis]KAA8818630.1 aminotransferase class I/II-fold pyridoxal phosphate-dependent enzyme [Bifidobacterium vespertilionis]KAA8823085.1 aminotransferase class I/II-fold pyridoxal phosphate-dependent enzyme [Bifidobacterium vespertilionis]